MHVSDDSSESHVLAFHSNDCWGPTPISINQRHHFAFVYDYAALTQFIYLTGVLECRHNSSGPFLATTGAIVIRAINNTGSTPRSCWTGYIDQISYGSKAKTAVEILTDATLVASYPFDGESFSDSGSNEINGVRLRRFSYVASLVPVC